MAVGTLYDLLGIAPTAGTEEIRSAYRKLSKLYHPDLGGSAAFFRQLQEGYEVLTDPIRRAAYDRSLAKPRLLETGSSGHRQASSSRADNRTGGNVSTRRRAYVRQPYNYGQPSGPGPSGPLGADVAPNYRRLLDSWSRGVDSLAVTSRARRRRDIVSATWISSVIVAGVVVGTLLEATHGLVLLVLLIMAVVAWRRHESTKRKAERRERAAQAAAELNRMARVAAEKRRVAHAAHAAASQRGGSNVAAATRERPAHARSTDPRHATGGWDGELENRQAAVAAARSGNLEVIAGSSAQQFEYTMVAFLGMLGKTDVHRVGERSEQTVDFAAIEDGGRTTMVRCNRDAMSKTTGAEDLRRLVDTEGVDHVNELELLITTSTFTSDARDLARRRGIQLIDGVAIEQLARRWRESHR